MENMQQSATLSASSLRISVVARRPYGSAREILQKTWTGTELTPAIHSDFIFSVYLDFFLIFIQILCQIKVAGLRTRPAHLSVPISSQVKSQTQEKIHCT